jgi:hypothetical protein
VYVFPRTSIADPAGIAAARCDFAVQRGSQFQDYKWPAPGNKFAKRFVETLALPLHYADAHPDARATQCPKAIARDERVGIFHPRDDFFNSSANERPAAWRSSSEMAARLQIDVERRSLCLGAGALERHDFGVIAAGQLVESAPNDFTIANQHRSDHGIRAGPAGGF